MQPVANMHMDVHTSAVSEWKSGISPETSNANIVGLIEYQESSSLENTYQDDCIRYK